MTSSDTVVIAKPRDRIEQTVVRDRVGQNRLVDAIGTGWLSIHIDQPRHVRIQSLDADRDKPVPRLIGMRTAWIQRHCACIEAPKRTEVRFGAVPISTYQTSWVVTAICTSSSTCSAVFS